MHLPENVDKTKRIREKSNFNQYQSCIETNMKPVLNDIWQLLKTIDIFSPIMPSVRGNAYATATVTNIDPISLPLGWSILRLKRKPNYIEELNSNWLLCMQCCDCVKPQNRMILVNFWCMLKSMHECVCFLLCRRRMSKREEIERMNNIEECCLVKLLAHKQTEWNRSVCLQNIVIVRRIPTTSSSTVKQMLCKIFSDIFFYSKQLLHCKQIISDMKCVNDFFVVADLNWEKKINGK